MLNRQEIGTNIATVIDGYIDIMYDANERENISNLSTFLLQKKFKKIQ